MKAQYTEQTSVQFTKEMRRWLDSHAADNQQKLADSIRQLIEYGQLYLEQRNS